MKELFFSLFLVASILTLSQDILAKKPHDKDHKISFGIRTGINISSIGGDFKNTLNEFTDLNNKIGFDVGAIIDVPIWKALYVQSGLFFTTKGAETKYEESDEENKGTPNDEKKGSFNAMYLEIPILLSYRFNLDKNMKWHIHFGPYIAYGIGGKARYANSENGERQEKKSDFFGKSDDSYGFNRFDTGLSFGTGLSFKHHYIGLQYELGLANVANKTYWGKKTSFKMNNLAISYGYNF